MQYKFIFKLGHKKLPGKVNFTVAIEGAKMNWLFRESLFSIYKFIFWSGMVTKTVIREFGTDFLHLVPISKDIDVGLCSIEN